MLPVQATIPPGGVLSVAVEVEMPARKKPEEWLGKPDGPKAKLTNEKPKGVTMDYDELVKRWTVSK